ncbi:MAG: SpoIIE family protein phosphatase, partial [Natronospirillum sp.]
RLRTEWRYKISQHVESPSDVLRHLNKELLRSKIGKHATLFIGILDTLNQRYSYANAAHFPYPVLEVDNRTEVLEMPSAPLGLFKDATYEERSFSYQQYIAVAFCSDGMLEVNPNASLSEREQNWLNTVISKRFNIPAIWAAMGVTDDTEAPDDMTAMAVTHWNSKS